MNQDLQGTDHKVAVETHELSVAYAGRVVLKDVSLKIARSKITATIGPSGCGKTSFLQSLNRIGDMIAGCTVTGQVTMDGANILEPSTDLVSLRRRVGMIFQKPNPFPLSIRKNIQLALREHRIGDRDEIDSITERVLRDVGLWDEVSDRLDSSALKLSGGQQQRLCIARALALSPEVLLFDEPCSALDPVASRVVEALIGSLRKQTTIVIVTHNLAQARRIADNVAMFWYENGTGALVEFGTSQTIFENPRSPITAAYVQGTEG